MSDKIFFSYSRVDTTFVLKLANDLRNAGANIWLDQLDIPPGAHWDNAIEEALNSATCVLAIISPKSMESKNAMDEISFALEQNKRVIPVLLTNTEPSFRLRRLQRIDFTGDYDVSVKQLLKTIDITNYKAPREEPVSPRQGITQPANFGETSPIHQPPLRETQKDLSSAAKAEPDHEAISQKLIAEIQQKILKTHFSEPIHPLGSTAQPKSNSLKLYAAILTGVLASAGITWGLIRYANQPKDSATQNNIPTVLSNRVITADSLQQETKLVTNEDNRSTLKDGIRGKKPATVKPAEIKPAEVKPTEAIPAKVPGNEIQNNVIAKVEKDPEPAKPQQAEEKVKPGVAISPNNETPKEPPTESPIASRNEAAPATNVPRKIKIRKDIPLSVVFARMPDMTNKRKMQPVTLIVTTAVEYDGKVIIEKGATAEGEISIGTVASTLVIKRIKSAGNQIIPSPVLEDGIAVRNINLTRTNIVIIEKGTKISL